MATSRAAAVQTVYHKDLVPDGLLMRFCKKMQFGEMTELIVLQTFKQSLGNMDTVKLSLLCVYMCVWVSMTWYPYGRSWGSDSVYIYS